MIVVEYDNKNDRLEIHGTPQDLVALAELLHSLAKRVGDHEHLKTPSWAGEELGERPVDKRDTLINHVKISCWEKVPSVD